VSDRSAASHVKHTATAARDAFASYLTAGAHVKAASSVAIARRLEERFILDGWPEGRCYGREDELAEQFAVSCNRVREAARILEIRGTARMRRGRMGGLETSAPQADAVRDMVWAYCAFAEFPAQPFATPLHTERGIPPTFGANRILGFYTHCLDAMDRPKAPQDAPYVPPALRSTRVGQIVHDLMLRRGAGGWLEGQVLASESSLCDQYQVDRGVMRQALRVLEAAGVAVSVPGRGYGLIALPATPDSLCQLICCHFSAIRVTPRKIQDAFDWLNEEAFALADRDSLAEPIQPDLCARAANPVLELLRRSLRALAVWNMQKNRGLPTGTLPLLEPVGV